MKILQFITLLVISLVIGLVIENYFDLIGDTEQSDPQEQTNTDESKPSWKDEFKVVEIESPMDGSLQPSYFYQTTSDEPQPLIVSLHTWSHDYTQYDSINEFSLNKNLNYIHPNFRGVNNKAEACCSELVISDIDAAIDYALENANVDPSEIYVIGVSGGGYATLAMFMKSKHLIKKFSSWVPLVDLVRWHDETKIRKLKYTDEILACTSSENGLLNEQIAQEKSPINWETPADKLNSSQLAIYTGVYDGIIGNGVIPITHSINFYNKLLGDLQIPDSSLYVSNAEKLSLLEFRKPLGDFGLIADRKVVLEKETNNIKLTLFDGGHEMLERFAFDDLFQ